MATILANVQEVAQADLALQPPASLFAAYNEGDTSDVKLRRALNRTVTYLGAKFDWSILKARVTIQALGAELQTGKLPADYLRMVHNTFWDESLKREVCGPLPDDEYAETKSGAINRVEPAWMLMGGELYLTPAPPANREYSFTYVRNHIGKNASNARIAAFTADTDTALWDDELIKLGIVFNYRKAERFDYAQDELDFMLMVQDRLKNDGGGTVIRMGRGAKSSAELVARMKNAALIIPE